ncbi:MAG: hypothetical protein ACODAU_12930 [Myxococcota bacterium]
MSGIGWSLRDPIETGRTKRSVRDALAAFVARRRAWILFAAALSVVLAAFGLHGADAGRLDASLAAALADRGLDMDPESVLFLTDDPGPLRGRPALFLARAGGGAPDLYYAEVRAGDHAVLDVTWLRNLTRTSSAAEQPPIRAGDHVLYASQVGDRIDAVTVLDLRGEPPEVTAGWPVRTRLQNRITNLQETGRSEGFGRRRYALDPPAERAEVRVRDGRFELSADGSRIVIDPARVVPVAGADRVTVHPLEKGQPGTITWLVDTVRNLSFVGPEPIAWLEHRVYGAKDWAERTWHRIAGSDDAAATEAEVAAAYGYSVEETRRRLALAEPDPETGWPPARLDPVLSSRVRGEGEWMAIDDDPFVAGYPNAPPPFYQTFLRVDPERLYVRVYLVAFDPRQVQMRIMSGTKEPESATGATAPGRIPREPEVLERVVGAFNGGFQALHGEFGMMSDGRVYLPPKPWAATVAVMDDGQVAMGSWLEPPDRYMSYLEEWAVRQIPDAMVDFRQNLTSVVEDGKYNPWKRWYWGAAPLNADEQTFITRSGLCLTEEGFLVYFWGESMGSEQLGQAMNAARCVRGVHLDMNTPHTGFELYDVRPKDAPHAPLDRELGEGEWEGPVSGAPGHVARARLAVRSMDPMRFPRYLDRDPRDFFYLTMRSVLPGPHLEARGGDAEAGRFSTAGLPHAGWPHAFARAFLGGEQGERTWLVRIDPRRALPAPVAAHDGMLGDGDGEVGEGDPDAGVAPAEPRVLARLAGAREASGPVALYAVRQRVGWRYGVGKPPDGAVVVVRGTPLDAAPKAHAALGLDSDGFVVYAERQPGDSASLVQRMREARVERALALPAGAYLALLTDGHHVSPDAFEREVDPAQAVDLLADPRPAARVLFPDVEPRPYHVWARMQDTRVRYFKEGEPRFKRHEDGGVEEDAP